MQNSRLIIPGNAAPYRKLGVFGNFGNFGEYFFEVSSPPRLPFCTIPKTENSEMKTSGFSLRHFDQTLRFSIFKFSVWGMVQKRNLGVGETRS